MVYGQSGHGKTTLAATFPGPVRWLICSGGVRSGELKSVDTAENRRKIKPVQIHSADSFREEVERAGSSGYATVVLDHATGYADLVLKEILGVNKIPIAKYKSAGKGESWSLVSKQQYGQQATVLKEDFRELLNLPCNVVVIAQERTFGGDDDGAGGDVIKPTVGAALSPSVAGWLNPACDYVVQAFKRPRMVTGEVEVNGKKIPTTSRGQGVDYCIRTEPHDVFMTKFRVPRGRTLPDVIVDPTYDKIMKVIKG